MDDETEFVYTGEDARTYEGQSLEVQRGDTVTWPDGAPDYRWSLPGSDQAKEALAEKEDREIAEAAEAGEPEIPDGDPVPAGAAITGSVPAINDYLDGLKVSDPALYLTERDRLFAEESAKPVEEQRKGLLAGRHANPEGV